jgi:endo-alpha-1,4-polygalactosaminidase (GH114 family)
MTKDHALRRMLKRRFPLALLAGWLGLAMASCSGSDEGSGGTDGAAASGGTAGMGGAAGSGGSSGDWYQPGIDTTWQWQLQPSQGSNSVNTSYDVGLYDIDLFDNEQSVIAGLQAEGKRVICYFSAGSYEDYRDDADRFDESDLGTTLSGFADERWVDVRSENVRSIMGDRLSLAASKGCDGVEPDNVDGYTNNPGFDFTAADQLNYNRWLAREAHNRGLSVGLKNDLDQIPDLVGDFDFSVNEQCHEYDECELLQPFTDADKAVFVAEYLATYVTNQSARDAMCADSRSRSLRTLVLPLDLDDSLRFSCDP